MKNIFLTSSLQTVAKDLSKYFSSPVKKFLFIITASEVEEGDLWWLKADRASLSDLGYELEDFSFTGKTKADVKEKFNQVDGIIMAGGNTFYLLQQIQLSDSAGLIRDYVKNSKIYIGSSAGSMVAGPDIYITREAKELKMAKKINGFGGLGITDLMIQPHWGSDSFKQSYLGEIMKHSYVPGFKQILLSDSQYVIVDDNNFQIIDVEMDK